MSKLHVCLCMFLLYKVNIEISKRPYHFHTNVHATENVKVHISIIILPGDQSFINISKKIAFSCKTDLFKSLVVTNSDSFVHHYRAVIRSIAMRAVTFGRIP